MNQKTFDQIWASSPDMVNQPNGIAPNAVIPCNVVLEPNTHAQQTRVRVTARDSNFNILRGANISEPMIQAEHPTPVAIYGRLREIIRENVSNPKPRFEFSDDPYAAIEACQTKLHSLIQECISKSVSVKKKSETTDKRAEHIAGVMYDAVRQLAFGLREVGIGGDAARVQGADSP